MKYRAMGKKRAVFFVGVVIIGLGGVPFYYLQDNRKALPSFVNTQINTYKGKREKKHTKKYIIQKAGQTVASEDNIEDALQKAKEISRSIVINTYNDEWVYCDLQPYFIITDTAIHDFEEFREAYLYAKKNDYKEIYYKNNENRIWYADHPLTDTKLDVPLILQMPELPRGCEVTSLAMILNYRGVKVDKMTLAAEVKKDPTPYSKDEKGRIHYGNPYDGFVGDMYNAKKNGYGVYHGPITELARAYKGKDAIDLTDVEFEDVLYLVQQGNPVWVITNGTYRSLDDTNFEMWHTPTGIVKITKKLHSVVITGFTEKTIFINDPLNGTPNIAVNREEFKAAWEQMGKQAMTIVS